MLNKMFVYVLNYFEINKVIGNVQKQSTDALNATK